MVIDEFVAEDAEPGGDTAWAGGETWQGHACARARVDGFESVSYGLVLLKMKKALPSGMGVIFSFFTRSEMTGRGPAGTSGSSSSPAGSSSSSSFANRAARVRTQGCANCRDKAAVGMLQDTFSSFSSSFLSLQERVKIQRTSEHFKRRLLK